MKRQTGKHRKTTGCAAAVLVIALWFLPAAFAKDTDIYSVNAKQNCYILMDSSGSMAWGVYEHTIDYGAMYDYFYALKDTAIPVYDYIKDPVSGGALFNNHKDRQKIYLVSGDPSVTIGHADGKDIAFTGDPGNPSVNWDFATMVDTHTLVDENGDLSDDGTGQRRITVDGNGYVLLDGAQLPLGMTIKLHDLITLFNGSVVDNGFGGVLNAPGHYFSGYEGIDTSLPYTANNVAESGDQNIFFFVTGNWINMQAVYNLTYNVNPPGAAGTGDSAWKYEPYPLGAASWATVTHALDYPAGAGNYANNLAEATTAQSIVHPGALKIRVHFSAFDVQGNGNAGTFANDYVKVYDATGALMAQYDNDNKPTSTGGWSPDITGNTATIKLKSNNSTSAAGYTIDKIAVVYQVDAGGGATYLMQSRLDVAKDAMLYVVEEFRGKMNWGFASFGNNATGAQLGPFLNPSDNDDTQRAAIATQVANVTASGGTPLMEALEDIFESGYYGRRNILDDMLCRKNYIISMTDGFPSADDDNTRIAGVTFHDWDGDGWTQDPSQYASPNPDYYDDVAHWMYTHSWLDKSVVADPANSYVNVTTHHISFGANHPLLKDAAEESGGQFIVAYNKEQLVAAFYSLALMMSKSISFTAPVVSVDAVNKTQNGDDLYMGYFLPMDSGYWVGNVKKFKLGDKSQERPELWMVYDHDNKSAIDSEGAFLDNTAAFWGDDTDVNDSDHHGGADIQEDGVGEVLLEDVQSFLSAGTYWKRSIYTYKNNAMTKFDRTNITEVDLSVADTATRDKLVNFIHGYTYDADAAGAPLAVKSWVLGPIIHSRPTVVDYYDTAAVNLPLLKRMVVVGANDGMLHVFDDTTGREIFAFIPDDILPKLKNVQANKMYDTVDGGITLYRRNKNPKYLIFGERRGGGAYWCLDVHDQNPLNWTVAWKYTNAEISESWSDVKLASIPVGITAAGKRTYKDVAVFTGGYDDEEDSFPEPFTDSDGNGTPLKADGITVDVTEWNKNDAAQDVYDDNLYNKYNPGMNESGRGIFVVDIDDPAAETTVTLADTSVKKLLPFSVTYGAASLTSGNAQTLTGMKFCFPASPGVVAGTDKYVYDSGGGILKTEYQANVLRVMYAIDVYANLFKVEFDFQMENKNTTASPNWVMNSAAWKVQNIFAGNPGSKSGSGNIGKGVETADQGRKVFYPPTISWGGTEGYFERTNYFFPNVTFSGREKMATLFFGTGDREHPRYAIIRNRFYAVYDDSSVTAKEYNADSTFKQDITVSSTPYTEDKLLNVTCDELGRDTIISTCYLGNLGGVCDSGWAADNISAAMKQYLKGLLTDDATYGSATAALENGAAHEDDAKGWYIVLEDQGKAGVCGDHIQYPTTISADTTDDRDNHLGEQILAQTALFAGILHFSSYQPAISDPCNPQGNGFIYALDYRLGSAAYNLNGDAAKKEDVTDRYTKYVGIFGIPSGAAILIREGQVGIMFSVGEKIGGGGDPELKKDGDDTPPYDGGPSGARLQLYYWRDSSSLE